MIVNCQVDDIDPGESGEHADAWQHGLGNSENKTDDNVIVYGLRATNLKYQSLFIRGDISGPPSKANGMAFVNVYMAMAPDSFGYGGWFRWVDHLLWWNCSFAVKGIGISHDTYQSIQYDCSISNFSCKGCDFAFMGVNGGDQDIDWTGWDNNHFVDPDWTQGTDATTGDDMLNARGVPRLGSPLVRRFDMAETVGVDADNYSRGPLADVGAYQWRPTWVPKDPEHKPARRKDHGMAYDVTTGKVVLFGGTKKVNGVEVDDNETWEWDGTDWANRTPNPIPPPSSYPAAQHGPAMGCFGTLTMVGVGDGETSYTWEWYNTTWNRAASVCPPEREYASLTFDTTGQGFLFGGRSGTGPLSDLWTYYGNYLWAELSPTEDLPVARYAHAMDNSFNVWCWPDKECAAVMFGGTDGEQVFGDTWLFQGMLPPEFAYLASLPAQQRIASISSRVMVPCGVDPEGWQRIYPSPAPPARYAAATAGSFLFGGTDDLNAPASNALDDTWEWVRTEPPVWVEHAIDGPTARMGHRMVHDLNRNVIVLFGGQTADEVLSDETWELDLND